jgi:hypothetical protein
MTTQEFFVRRVTDTDARGPFSFEQLASLAENGQVDPETLYYDAASEQWVVISQNPTLTAQLFPQKRSLTVKPKAEVKTLNKLGDKDSAISVDDMLAAADGRTRETRAAADPNIAKSRAAVIGMYAAMVILLILGAGFVIPHFEILSNVSSEPGALLSTPQVILGVFLIFLGMILALGATGAYPVVRFAAMLTLGFAGFLFWLDGQTEAIYKLVAATVGLYLCTVFTNLPLVFLSLVAGIGGAFLLVAGVLAT